MSRRTFIYRIHLRRSTIGIVESTSYQPILYVRKLNFQPLGGDTYGICGQLTESIWIAGRHLYIEGGKIRLGLIEIDEIATRSDLCESDEDWVLLTKGPDIGKMRLAIRDHLF